MANKTVNEIGDGSISVPSTLASPVGCEAALMVRA
jgi:hypothetical protein